MKRWNAFTAAVPSPGTASGSAAASHTVMPAVLAQPITRDIEVAPIPRRGELTMRPKLTTSCGLTSTVRYATASLISARS